MTAFGDGGCVDSPRVDDVDARAGPDDRGHLGEDGDAVVALEIVGIERRARARTGRAEGAGSLEQPVDEGGLSMVSWAMTANCESCMGSGTANVGRGRGFI